MSLSSCAPHLLSLRDREHLKAIVADAVRRSVVIRNSSKIISRVKSPYHQVARPSGFLRVQRGAITNARKQRKAPPERGQFKQRNGKAYLIRTIRNTMSQRQPKLF